MAQESLQHNELTYIEGFNNAAIQNNLKRICGQCFKLLCLREEGADYIKPLETIYIEVLGLGDLLESKQESLLALASKLNGLRLGGDDIGFPLYRRTIFECCGLASDLEKSL